MADRRAITWPIRLGELDAIVDSANQANLKVLLSVAHAPAFYRGANSGLFPADASRFQTFMQALATRYRGKVNAYEIWNEQNLARETGVGNVAPSSYLPILKAGSTGVRAADSTALILLGAPSPTGANLPGRLDRRPGVPDPALRPQRRRSEELLRRRLRASKRVLEPADCTPAMSQCSLSGGWNNDPSFFAFTRVQQYRDLMVKNGEAVRRSGFPNSGTARRRRHRRVYEYCRYLSPQQQADFLVQAFQKARALDYVGGMVVWNLNFQFAVGQTDEKWGFGVLRNDWTPRPRTPRWRRCRSPEPPDARPWAS